MPAYRICAGFPFTVTEVGADRDAREEVRRNDLGERVEAEAQGVDVELRAPGVEPLTGSRLRSNGNTPLREVSHCWIVNVRS